jgi:hypothetical protein
MAGLRGGRYISVEASARGEWKAGGSRKAGFDAYSTSKQCKLATVLAFARETPRLRFDAVEPGFSLEGFPLACPGVLLLGWRRLPAVALTSVGFGLCCRARR